jgi:hypothetical protein
VKKLEKKVYAQAEAQTDYDECADRISTLRAKLDHNQSEEGRLKKLLQDEEKALGKYESVIRYLGKTSQLY